MIPLNNIYTREEIETLLVYIHRYLQEHLERGERINWGIKLLSDIIRNYLNVKKPDLLWLNNKLKKAIENNTIYNKSLTMMYILPLEDMPPYINEDGWGEIARWRLYVGR
jgi:hypothetical protein